MSNWIRNTTGEPPFLPTTLVDVQFLNGELHLCRPVQNLGWSAPGPRHNPENDGYLIDFYRLYDGTEPEPATSTPIETPAEESPEYLAAKASRQYASNDYVVIPTPDGESSISRREEGAWVRAWVFVEYDK